MAKREGKTIRTDLTIQVAKQISLGQAETKVIIQKLIAYIAEALEEGKRVEIRGFGAFDLKVAKEKLGRNPRKPQNEVLIPEHVVAKFKPGSFLKNRIFKIDPKIVKNKKKQQ